MALQKQKGTNKEKIHARKYRVFILMGILLPGILLAGCTQSSDTGPAATVVSVSSPSPTEAVTAVPTTVPQPVVTIIHYISQTREIKDSRLLFSLEVPVEWNVSTYRLVRSDTPDYRTDPGADTGFSMYHYYFSQNKDTLYRGQVREWSPAPTETTVTMNGITYDRFESTSGGRTNVSYIVRGSSANERGYTSILTFTARDSKMFEKADLEKIVSSFRYFGIKSASAEPGEEIPLYEPSGTALSGEPGGGRSLAWGEWEGDSSGDDSSNGDSSGGDSSGGSSSGGGCGCGG